MTEEEMRKRMKEIDEERSRLSSEKKKYEDYFYNKKQQDRMKDHKEYVGKCYVSIDGLQNNSEKQIKAFKILEVLEPHHENYALCVALIDGYRYTCWNEYGVQRMTLGLWNANTNRMISNPNDPKTIDFYKEISQEEFERLYREYSNNLEDEVYL